jgi:hypothetical protein
LSLAAGAKLQSVIDEGLSRFAHFKQPSDLPASTRSIVYFVGARYGSDEDFARLLDLHNAIKSADEKEELAGGLTGAKDSARLKRLIDMLTGDHIRRQDLMHWFVWLLRNRYGRSDTWQWLQTNWDWVQEAFDGEKTFGYFPRYCGSVFSTQTELDEFLAFFDSKRDIVAMGRDITLAEQDIVSRVSWRARNEAPVRDWLLAH